MKTMGWIAASVSHDRSQDRIESDQSIRKIVTDSRSLQPGDFFVALPGQHFDGHDFVSQAFQIGAVGAMVEARYPQNHTNLIHVADTYLGLGAMAKAWREQHPIPVIGITGSSGKTTTKGMLSAILSLHTNQNAVLATPGNLNNHIGLPLTLLSLNPFHQYAVIEMGMNHAGEIAYLTQLTRPTVAIVLNVLRAHIGGGFASVEAIAAAKAEIFEGLPPEGIAIIPVADHGAVVFEDITLPYQRYRFGLEKGDIHAEEIRLAGSTSFFDLVTPQGKLKVHLSVPGMHNVSNALAAAAAAFALNIALPTIAQGLSLFSGMPGRLCFVQNGHQWLIDDTYNANPDAMRAAIDVLISSAQAPYILVMGDMAELGEKAEELHQEVGRYAKTHGVERLFALGPLSQLAAQAFGEKAEAYDAIEDLYQALKAYIGEPATILVKGSRAMCMERVVQYLSKPSAF